MLFFCKPKILLFDQLQFPQSTYIKKGLPSYEKQTTDSTEKSSQYLFIQYFLENKDQKNS